MHAHSRVSMCISPCIHMWIIAVAHTCKRRLFMLGGFCCLLFTTVTVTATTTVTVTVI